MTGLRISEHFVTAILDAFFPSKCQHVGTLKTEPSDIPQICSCLSLLAKKQSSIMSEVQK